MMFCDCCKNEVNISDTFRAEIEEKNAQKWGGYLSLCDECANKFRHDFKEMFCKYKRGIIQ